MSENKSFDELLLPVRNDIDHIDKELLKLFTERMQCAERVAEIKRKAGIPVLNAAREQVILDRVKKEAGKYGDSAVALYSAIMSISRARQHNMLKSGARTRVLPGSGVDLVKHPVLPWPENEKVHFLFTARVMKEKGRDLFLAAARKFASENVIFDVCGACDDENYKEILNNEKCVTYHGEQKDMTPFYSECSCFLYPSYYPEGMSNVLLEAAASGRPVIAADRAGCRETLDDGVTGFLVPVNDEKAVIEATEKILQMTSEERKAMGLRGSEKIRREFDRKLVVEAYWEEIQRIYRGWNE